MFSSPIRSWFSSEIKNLNVINVPRMTLDVNEQHNIEVSLENVSKEEYNIRVLNIFELVNLREIQTTYTSNDCIKKGIGIATFLPTFKKKVSKSIFSQEKCSN